jgi:hypothetical protein
MRIDYIWTTDQPLACSLFTKKVTHSKWTQRPTLFTDRVFACPGALPNNFFVVRTMQLADGTSFSDHMGVAAVLGLRSNEQPSALLLGSKPHANSRMDAISTSLDTIRQGEYGIPCRQDEPVAGTSPCCSARTAATLG